MSRVLLIEDDDLLRGSLRQALGHMGHSVAEARNGREGLRMQADDPAELVITDLLMPEKEGLETIMELRRAAQPVKIIAMSGGGWGAADDYLSVARRLGATGTLEKPFTMEQMSAAICGALGAVARAPVAG